MAENEISVHDKIVQSYEVNCMEQRIVLHTFFKYGQPPYELTDVIFEGVCVYRFQDDWLARGNMLLDIERVELKYLVVKYETEFVEGWRYGWPAVGEFETIPQLLQRLEEREVSAFEIAATIGLCGFVIARSMRFVSANAP